MTYGMLCLVTEMTEGNQPVSWAHWIEIDPLAPREYVQVERLGYDDREGRIVGHFRLKADVDRDGQPEPERVPGLAEQPVVMNLEDFQGQFDPGAAINARESLRAANDTAQLFVTTPEDGERLFVVSVDGYPRAFKYAVSCVRNGRVNNLRPRSDAYLNLHQVHATYTAQQALAAGDETQQQSPAWTLSERKDPVPLRAPCENVVLRFEVDAPEYAWNSPDAPEFVQVDLASKLGETLDTVRLFADRQVTTQLSKLGEGGLLVLQSTVRDYTIGLSPGGRSNVGMTINARLVMPNHPMSRSAELVLDGERPQLELESGAARRGVSQGTAVEVHWLATDQYSGITKVELGLFDGNGTPTLDAIKPDAIQSRDTPEGSWKVETKELEPGKTYYVVARATDHVGLRSDQQIVELRITEPRPETPMPDQPGTVAGVLTLESQPNLRSGGVFNITLEGSNKPPLSFVRLGSPFRFDNVPPGKYKLVASGSFSNQGYEGEIEVEPSPKDNPKVHRLPVKKATKN